MKTWSEFGWNPAVYLWEEPGTVLSQIHTVNVILTSTSRTINMYHANQHGLSEILEGLQSKKYMCSEVVSNPDCNNACSHW